MLGKRFRQLAWLHVIQAGVYREALEICRSSRMSTSISGLAGPGTRHLRGACSWQWKSGRHGGFNP